MTIGADYETVGGLKVHPSLRRFVDNVVLQGAALSPDAFWPGLASIIADLAPRHHELLAVRADLQARIDEYHRTHRRQPHDAAGYEQFLREIGYLVPAPAADAYKVATKNVDAEMAIVAGPQLVASLSDADAIREAVHGRWGSLYDALAKGDAEGGASTPPGIEDVIAQVRAFLDRAFPLAGGSHADAAAYMVERDRFEAVLPDGSRRRLWTPGQFAGFTGPRHEPKSILLRNNGLHLELRLDRDHPVGQRDAAGLADVIVEAVPSVIMDLDDAVTAVDAEGKVVAYRNWHGLVDGSFHGEGALPGDRNFTTPDGGRLVLAGSPVMLLRHVGHHVFTDAVLDGAGNPVPEAIIDAAVTVASALQDIGGNSRTGSIYVIKPRMHGPDEVGLADLLFKRIEELVGLPKYTMKIGLMDEERRTSVNLAACMSRVRDRTFMLRTSAEERIGDEIRTAMEAGPMPRRAEMAEAAWFQAYEAHNVDTGIARNLPGRAQIGKDMAAPGADKTVYSRAGLSSVSVPTPVAAVLQAVEFHRVDAIGAQDGVRLRPAVQPGDQLALPVAAQRYTPEEIEVELEGNLHHLLATACALHNRGIRMPGNGSPVGARAKLRSAGRHLANWLHHEVIDEAQLRGAMQRIAAAMDLQNARVEGYRPLSPDERGPAFRAIEKLVFDGDAGADAILPAIG